jgi:hypothetical protein
MNLPARAPAGRWPALAILLVAGALSGAPALSATYYVDGNCPSSGAGTSLACGSSGPKKTVDEGIALLSGAGDVLEIRGVHPPHDGESGTFDGRYYGDWFRVTGKNGASGSHIVIQNRGYSGPGTGEVVFLDGTRAPSSGWTRCSDCASGICAGVPSAGCSQTWYATDNGTAPAGFPGGNANLVIGAQKDDGSPTFRVSSPSDLTNSHPVYNPKRCSVSRYMACFTGVDCPSGETCSATSPEIDSYSPQNGGPILVRWGSSLPASPYVFYNNNGIGFFVSNSSFITIRGFVFRCHRRSAVAVTDNFGAARDVILEGNRILYADGSNSEGSDYGIVVYRSQNVSILNNQIGYTVSEGIHAQAMRTGTTTLIIRGNWVHDQGDAGIFGPGSRGTPSGLILGESDSNSGFGDYTGSFLENNLIERQASPPNSGSIGRGVILENAADNWIIRDNVFRNPHAECLKLDATVGSVSGNQIYNNLFLGCGQQPGPAGGGGPAMYFYSGSGKSTNNNKVYHNTVVNGRNGAIVADCFGTCTGNEIRNNIFYDATARRQVNWPPTGKFQNNLVFAPGTGTLVTFNGGSLDCAGLVATADVDRDGVAGDQVRCLDPLFASVGGNDFHLAALSPALDGATTTGVPAGRTASLRNTLAGTHGLPSYSDGLAKSGSAWDIGVAEYAGASVPTASLALSDPSPTGAGTVTVTLTTSVPVVQLPGPLSFRESDNTTTTIGLSGTVPGSVFTGLFVVDASVADGPGTFSLPADNLVTSTGLTGNSIVSGAQTVIDRTLPSTPTNLRFGN